MKKVVIEPITRVEGHGKVTILMDEKRRVTQARLHIVEFRGFERFVQGKSFKQVPIMVQRLCGICPVSHLLCASKAMDYVVGGEALTPTAEKVRRLMHYGQVMQSDALHFFHLSSPDILFGFDAAPEERNIFRLIKDQPDIARKGIMLRRFGQEVIAATAGKRIHGTGSIPGGVKNNVSIEIRDALLKEADQAVDWSQEAMHLARDYCVAHRETVQDFGSFPSNHMALIREDGALDLYEGNLRVIDAVGKTILDHADYQQYLDILGEEVRPWSYMKFPFLKSLGPEDGWYRVGPLARLNACDFIDTPLAEAASQEFRAITGPAPDPVTMDYHWTRMIEVLHAAEKIRELLHDPDLQGTDLVAEGECREEGIAMLEAPRGSLLHHYKVDEKGLVVKANLIVSTTHNNEAMNRSVAAVAKTHLDGAPEITEALLNHIEVIVRAYDPCLSCATHALGQMPLIVDVIDHSGQILDKKIKG